MPPSASLVRYAPLKASMKNAFWPYKYLAIAGSMFLIASFFIPNVIFDFHSSQRYYVMEMDEAFRYISATFLTLFVIAFFLRRILFSIILSWMHVVVSVLVLTFIILFAYKANDAYVPSYDNWSSYEQNNSIILELIFSFMLCQTLLFVNVAWPLIRKRNGA
jgi:hypothetical protein